MPSMLVVLAGFIVVRSRDVTSSERWEMRPACEKAAKIKVTRSAGFVRNIVAFVLKIFGVGNVGL